MNFIQKSIITTQLKMSKKPVPLSSILLHVEHKKSRDQQLHQWQKMRRILLFQRLKLNENEIYIAQERMNFAFNDLHIYNLAPFF